MNGKNIFNDEKYSVQFDLLAKSVAHSAEINSFILKIISSCEKCSIHSMTKVSDMIYKSLKGKYNYDDYVIRDFCDCISGLKYYKARYAMECVSTHLPHLARFCNAIQAQTKIKDAFILDDKIKDTAKKMLDNIQNYHDDNSSEKAELQLSHLQSIASILYKNNPIVDKTISKYALEEKDINIEDIIKNFSK